MTPFRSASICSEELDRVRDAFIKEGLSPERAEKLVKEEAQGVFFINDKYQVRITIEDDLLLHLSIKRLDKEPIHDWRELQQIKNELVGEEHEAVELYPAESRCVDVANQFHLYAFKDPGKRFSFGFKERLVTDKAFGNSKQRSLK